MSHTFTGNNGIIMNKIRLNVHLTYNTILLIFGVFLLFSSGCERDADIQYEISLTDPIDSDVITGNTQFSINLFNEVWKADQDKNIFISPFSVSVALTMVLNGAADDTEQSIIETLQLQGISNETINSSNAQLHQILQNTDQKVTLTIANSLWSDEGFAINPLFVQRNMQFFDAEISSLDFSDPTSVDTINRWVDTNTDGNIPTILDSISPDEVLFLINAIYFKGSWQDEFDPTKTRDNPFHLMTGTTEEVPMMNREGKYPYLYEKEFQAISIPYGDGKISMYIFLPSRESNLNNFLARLSVENWENWMSQFHEQKVWVQIPKFKVEYGASLNDVLKSLGMEIAFDRNRANFEGIRQSGIVSSGNLYISKVEHKAFVEVNEEGTEAAAVTGIGIAVTSLPPQFIADRPFFFAIRDNESKTVLFMGTITDPTEND